MNIPWYGVAMATVSNSIDTRNSLQPPPYEKRLHASYAILIGRYFFPIRGAHVSDETFFEHGRVRGQMPPCACGWWRAARGWKIFVSRVATICFWSFTTFYNVFQFLKRYLCMVSAN